MKIRTMVTVAVAAAAIAGVYAAVAAAAPKDDPSQLGYLTVTEVHETPAGAERTPPPGWQPNPDFENGMDQPVEDADGNMVPPTVIVLPQGGW
ncbi:MAG: hypothetical protein ACOH1Y_13930 [Propionicimonas sp.]